MVKPYPTILLLGDSLTEMAFGPDGYGTAMVSDVRHDLGCELDTFD